MVDGGIQPVAKPGDWLEISDFELQRRLNLRLRLPEDTRSMGRATMLRIEGPQGELFGRASIAPSDSIFSFDGGWVTVSGLRATPLHNVKGIFLGEAMTAARDIARPLATKEALAVWASRQANLIAACTKNGEYQARSAEVVLECDGEIGNLKFLKLGTNWLTTSEFEERLRFSSELAISFDGSFSHEEYDEADPRDFNEHFNLLTASLLF